MAVLHHFNVRFNPAPLWALGKDTLTELGQNRRHAEDKEEAGGRCSGWKGGWVAAVPMGG